MTPGPAPGAAPPTRRAPAPPPAWPRSASHLGPLVINRQLGVGSGDASRVLALLPRLDRRPDSSAALTCRLCVVDRRNRASTRVLTRRNCAVVHKATLHVADGQIKGRIPSLETRIIGAAPSGGGRGSARDNDCVGFNRALGAGRATGWYLSISALLSSLHCVPGIHAPPLSI